MSTNVQWAQARFHEDLQPIVQRASKSVTRGGQACTSPHLLPAAGRRDPGGKLLVAQAWCPLLRRSRLAPVLVCWVETVLSVRFFANKRVNEVIEPPAKQLNC